MGRAITTHFPKKVGRAQTNSSIPNALQTLFSFMAR
jgi:hypothetical protein